MTSRLLGIAALSAVCALLCLPATARARGPAGLELRLDGLVDGKAQATKRVGVGGWVPADLAVERVQVRLRRNGRAIFTRQAPIERTRRGTGVFHVRTPVILRAGSYRVVVRLRAPEGLVRLESTPFGVRYPDLDPGDRGQAVEIFNRLLRRQAYYTKVSRRYGAATARAVLAFRKVNGIPRTTEANRRIFRLLANGKGGFELRYPRAGKHIEADLSRQVMVLARGGRARHIFHISSGKPSTPTVLGKYRAYRKEPGTNALGMIDSVYFHRGYATHGYKSVPTYPASHGCLRTPPANARFIYDWIELGDPFYIYR